MSFIEEQIMKLTSELKKLQENGDAEKKRNAQLEVQINELKDKLFSKNVQETLPSNQEASELNAKLKQLEGQFGEAEKRYNKKIEELKKEQGN